MCQLYQVTLHVCVCLRAMQMSYGGWLHTHIRTSSLPVVMTDRCVCGTQSNTSWTGASPWRQDSGPNIFVLYQLYCLQPWYFLAVHNAYIQTKQTNKEVSADMHTVCYFDRSMGCVRISAPMDQWFQLASALEGKKPKHYFT